MSGMIVPYAQPAAASGQSCCLPCTHARLAICLSQATVGLNHVQVCSIVHDELFCLPTGRLGSISVRQVNRGLKLHVACTGAPRHDHGSGAAPQPGAALHLRLPRQPGACVAAELCIDATDQQATSCLRVTMLHGARGQWPLPCLVARQPHDRRHMSDANWSA